MRTSIVIWLSLLCACNVACAISAKRSSRSISNDVSLLLLSLLPPMVGNLIIIVSHNIELSLVGSYIYFIGLDVTVVRLMFFTADYCNVKYRGTKLMVFILAIVAIDIFQILANIWFGHAFSLRETIVEGYPYYSLVPYAGQAFHRVVAYGIFFLSLGIFVYKVVTSPRIYIERYVVILLTMLFTGLWESYYIFSGTPVDQSMIGFGLFGLFIYYFAIWYKPIRLLDRMLSRLVEEMGEGLIMFDADGNCVYANERAREMFGIVTEFDLEQSPKIVCKKLNEDSLSFDRPWSMKKSVEVDGKQQHWIVEVKEMLGKEGKVDGNYLVVKDVTEIEENLRRERHLATHDSLTGLYNQYYLYEKARELIDENPSIDYRVVAFDIKEFKIINDIYGKEFGDEVLIKLGEKLRELFVPGVVIGRLSGDKFGAVGTIEQLSDVRLSEWLERRRVELAHSTHPIVFHIGVYDVVERDLRIAVMFDRAFMAVTSIKNDYQRFIATYDVTMRDNAIWNQRISNELEDAISNGQITPYLQPLVDMYGNVVGAEMLVRWIHPEEGFLSPARFIPTFEENGMIALLDTYMWECACRILKDWKVNGVDLFLSVNISPKDFYFLDVYETIQGLVKKYDVDPHKLRLEITETVMMSDMENRLGIIYKLRNSGFLVEMDDFGSGYSSLNMLKDIPVDVLKIDMMFLYKTKDQRKAQLILQTIINLSTNLGIPAITEGVETADQLDMLLKMGCTMFQGYYFAKPMPLGEFEASYR